MSNLVIATNSTPLNTNPVAVYLASLAPSSRRTMKQSLNAIALLVSENQSEALQFPWHELRYQHTQAIRAALASKYSAATANKALAAMKGVLKECRRLGLMSAGDREAASDLKPIKSQRLPKGRALSGNELEKLKNMILADNSIFGARDAAILAILRVGLRRAEVVNLDLKDYDAEELSLTIRGGKGQKDRVVYLSDTGSTLVKNWLSRRGIQPGPLIFPISKSGKTIPRRLTAQAIATIMNGRREEAGLALFSPHDFRRTCISDLLDAGVDIVTVQKLAGHADPATTSRYDRRGNAAKKKAANLLSF